MIYSGSITRFKLIRSLVLLVIPPPLVKTSISRNATLIKFFVLKTAYGTSSLVNGPPLLLFNWKILY